MEDLAHCYAALLSCVDVTGRHHCELFEQLPDRSAYPDYYLIIKTPIALDVIKQRMDMGKYTDLAAMAVDVAQMVRNAKRYNIEGSLVYSDAVALENAFKKEYRKKTKTEPLMPFDPRVEDMMTTTAQGSVEAAGPGSDSGSKRKRGSDDERGDDSDGEGGVGKGTKKAAVVAADTAEDKPTAGATANTAGAAAQAGSAATATAPSTAAPTAVTCPVCQRVFQQQQGLNKHMRIHRRSPAAGKQPAPDAASAASAAGGSNGGAAKKNGGKTGRRRGGSQTSPYPRAAMQVLESLPQPPAPLHYKEITSRAISAGYLTRTGSTPANTMHGQLIKNTELYSAGKGYFGLRAWTDDQGRVPGIGGDLISLALPSAPSEPLPPPVLPPMPAIPELDDESSEYSPSDDSSDEEEEVKEKVPFVALSSLHRTAHTGGSLWTHGRRETSMPWLRKLLGFRESDGAGS
eukprot:m.490166 g.490166  ORF g.490166 m.490166 type:complete len:460 (-) comp27537_c1_seq1:83-1462(-)